MNYYYKYLKYKTKYFNVLKGGNLNIDALYETLDCPFSAQNTNLGIPIKELTYGEMTQNGFQEMLNNVNTKDKVFYDLGSGNGKLVMYAVINDNFKKGVGIEIDPGKHECAEEFKNKYAKDKNIELFQGNFFDYDLSDADIIWISSLCFEDTTTQKLGKKISKEAKPGTIIFTSKAIDDPNFILEGTKNVEMTWTSDSTVYIYKLE